MSSSYRNKIKRDIKKLRIALIVFTGLHGLNLCWFFLAGYVPAHPLSLFNSFLLLGLLTFVLKLVFLYYLYEVYPSPPKSKTTNALLIFFLGIIGMWVWLPNDEDLDTLGI